MPGAKGYNKMGPLARGGYILKLKDMDRPPLSARLLFLPLAFLAVFLVYGSALDGGFVYDDHHFIGNNPAIKSLRNAPRFFYDPSTLSDISGWNSGGYRPLATLSYAVDHAAAGMTPGYFRAVNILLHGVNSLLVFYLGLLLGLAAPYAALMGAFFALFPANVESVAWASSRSTVLSTAFILCSVIFYLKHAAGGRPRQLLASALCAAAGLFTRETAVVIPLLALAHLLIFSGPSKKRLSALGLYLALPAALFVLLRFQVLGRLQQVPQPDMPLGTLISLPFLLFAKYLDVLVYPFSMLISYSDLVVLRLHSFWLYFPFSLLAFLCYCGLIWALLRKGEKTAAWGLLWVLIALLPALNIISMSFYMAERLLYLPLAGAAVALGAAGSRLGEARRARAVFFSACAVLLALFTVNIQGRLLVWHDDVALWSYDAEKNPWNFLTRLRLAEAQRAAGNYPAAVVALNDALDRAGTNKRRAMVYNELGALLAMGGEIKKARMYFQTSVTLNPDNHLALYNLGKTCAMRGDNAAARKFLGYSLALNGSYPPARTLLASLPAGLARGKAAGRAPVKN